MAPKIKSIKTGYAKDHKEAMAYTKGILLHLQSPPSVSKKRISDLTMSKISALLEALYMFLTEETGSPLKQGQGTGVSTAGEILELARANRILDIGKKFNQCPFCGNDDQDMDIQIYERQIGDGSSENSYSVLCSQCGAEGPLDDSEEGSVISWNKRTPLS